MARKIVERLVSDLSGIEDESVTTTVLAVNGHAIEIELTADERLELDEGLRPYLEAGRHIPPDPSRDGKPVATSDSRDIRRWAREIGLEVHARGRVPQNIRDAYRQATGD